MVVLCTAFLWNEGKQLTVGPVVISVKDWRYSSGQVLHEMDPLLVG